MIRHSTKFIEIKNALAIVHVAIARISTPYITTDTHHARGSSVSGNRKSLYAIDVIPKVSMRVFMIVVYTGSSEIYQVRSERHARMIKPFSRNVIRK